ncbi:MAG: hopanoid biosynthesis-associated protein HpnK [Sphingomonadaceae bacterium]|nr:hopanoid biosynthesis-associated protein HpnK [Sphingomonadaceae bacterium]
MKTLIVTADDFGADAKVNEAVEIGHRDGILTATSLMVGGAAAADAIERARRLPALGVGLHVNLAEGRPILPAEAIPGLVGRNGLFRTDMARLGAAIFFNRRVRRQAAAEIDAQFAAFAATGLALDHVNAHKHFHLHPTIAALIIDIGKHYGMAAARAAIEPARTLRAVEPTTLAIAALGAAPLARHLRRRLLRAGVSSPDHVFGVTWSGAMTPARVRGIAAHLPPGVTEIYLHPATANRFAGSARGYRYTEELAALTDPSVLETVRSAGVVLARFADLPRP